MNEAHIAHLVRQHLNRSAQAVPDAVVARLRQSRNAALARQKRPVHSVVLAAIGARLDIEDLPRKMAGVAVALLISLGGLSYWHSHQYIADLEEVDSAILTDDLPLDIFVDTGFDAWLQASGER